MGRWMGGWKNGWLVEEQTDGRIVESGMNKRMDKWTDDWMNG